MDKKLENLCKSLDLIEKQVVVLQQKQENIENLLKLNEVTYETKVVLDALKQNVSQKVEELRQTYEQILKRCQLQQLQMVNLLEKVEAVQGAIGRNGVSSRLPKVVLQAAVEQDFSPEVAPVSSIKMVSVKT